MNKTNDILEKLKHVPQPVIDNPEELTEMIMSRLDPAPSLQRRAGGGSIILPLVRTVLSLAAMWIIGFFIYLQYEASPRGGMERAISRGGWEGASTLREVYKYRLCQDCKETISYTQIKSMLYEKK